jgi:excisionase family DNA binding protein
MAISIDEAAQSLTLSRSSIKLLISQGRLRALKVGRRVLIPTVELERLLTASEGTA